MAVSDFFTYLASFSPLSSQDKNKPHMSSGESVSLFPSKSVSVLKPDKMKEMDQSIALSNFFAILGGIRSAFHFVTSGIEAEGRRAYQYFSQHYYSFRLKKAVEMGFNALRGDKPAGETEERELSPGVGRLLAEMRTQSSANEVSTFLSDKTQLKALSFLRKASEASPIDEEVFDAVFHGMGSYRAEALPKVIAYMKSCLPEDLLPSSRLSVLEEAVRKDAEFRLQVSGVKEEAPADQREKLRSLAQQMAHEVRELKKGSSYLTLSGVRNGKSLDCPLVDTIFSEFLPADLHQLLVGKNSDEVIQRLSLQLKTAIWGEKDETPGFRKKIEERIRSYLHQASRVTEAVLPEALLSGIKSSLKQDLEEILFGPPSEDGAEKLGEKIWANLKEKGIEKVIQESLLDALQSSRQIIDAQMDSMHELVSANLPPAAKPILGTLGLPKGEEEAVWFEFEKQANGKMKLTLFAQGSSAQPHPCGDVMGKQGLVLPLVYSDIDPANFDEAFFYTLLSYRALPEWDASRSFTVNHIHEGLIASLKKKPDAPTQRTLTSMDELRGEGVWKYLLHFLKYHIEAPSDEFEKTYAYQVRLQAFVRMWGHVLDDPEYLHDHTRVAQRFRVAISELSNQAVELYQDGKLSVNELKSLYATIWEAEQTLNIETPPPKTAASVVVPPDLQEMLKNLTLAIGVAPAHISLIKEALMVVYGADIEDVVDQAFKDLLPTLSNDEMNEMRSKRNSESLYTWAGIQKMGNQLKNFRFSLFHFVRLYVGVSKIMADIFEMSLASRIIEFLILAYFPSMMTYTSMSVGTLSKLLACFGPSILKPILPEPVYQSLRAVYRLIKEAITYVKRRLIFVVVRIIVRVLLGGEKATQLSTQARNWNQKMTRSGEISYEIPYGKNELGQLRLKPQKKPEPSSGSETTSVRPGIGKIVSPYGATSELPRPYPVLITKDNLKEELSKWILEATVLGNDQGLKRSRDEKIYQRLLYINRQFRNLKLPTETEMWDEVDPVETMKLLEAVVSSLSSSSIEDLSAEEYAEVLTTTYTAYALMDHLARRSDEAQLPKELQANGCDLGVWLQSPAARVIRKETYIQLTQTAQYFGFDLEKVYTEEEVDQRRSHCLFNYDGRGESIYTPAFMSDNEKASYLGFRHSKEGRYYQKLLRDPKVQQRLKGCGVTSETADWEQFKVLFSNPKGKQGNPLPEAFSMLRKMDYIARRCVSNMSFEAYVLPLNKRDESWFLFDTVRTCFHRCTGGIFRNQSFSRSMPFVNFATGHQKGIDQRAAGRGIEHQMQFENKLCRDKGETALLRRLQERSVNQVMASDPLSFKELSLQEKRLLELINSDKEDQIMQVLGFFNRTKGRLREPRFRFIFDLMINRLGALQCQMKRRSNLPETMGQFFKDALDHFEKQEDVETCLYLTKIGQELRLAMSPLPIDTFPDFRSFIRFRLIPHLRNVPSEKRKWRRQGREIDLIVLSYQHLILTYGSINPGKAFEEERNQAIEDIARLVYTSLPTSCYSASKKPDVMVKADEVLFLWEPYIQEAMKKDVALRKNVIESILRDVGMGTMVEEEDKWEGTYPVFSNGRITLDLTQNTQTSHEISVEIAKERAEEVVPDLGHGVRLSERSFSFPDKQVIIEFPEGTFKGRAPCTIYRQFSGVDYEFLPRERQELLQSEKPFELSKEEELWLERPRFGRTRHLLCLKGEEKLWRRPVRETKDQDGAPLFEVRWNRKVIDGVFVREVNLSQEAHGLALLSWFEDENEIKAYAHAKNPDQVAFIEFPKKGLRFEVREHGGQMRAMALGDATGYFISKTQRNEHLLKYGKYLLLENTRGKKKVFMTSKPLKTLMAEFILSQVGKIQTSPLIERYISSLTPDLLAKESELLSFDLDDKGNLTTSDPMGFAYLALFNFIKGDKEASLRYFSELEDYGRKHPFPKKIYEIFELMYLPLLCSQDRFSREMTLRLGAIQIENQLIQHSEETGTATLPSCTSETTKMLQWILMQIKYSEYLSGVKAGIPPALNEYQELFLLTGIGEMNTAYYKQYLGSNLPETLRELGKKVGIENLANSFLFQPEVMERYHELRLQLDRESKTSSLSRGLVLQADKKGEGKKLEGEVKGSLGDVIHLVDQAKNSAFLKNTISPVQKRSFYHDVDVFPDLSTLPTTVWELNQAALNRYFPLYYRLAKNERGWMTDKELFNRKRQELLRTLELMHGNESAEASLKREILQEVSASSTFYHFPSASRLESMIRDRQHLNLGATREERNVFDKFISDELISVCRKARFSKRVINPGTVSKVVKAVPQVVDGVLYYTPGYLLPFPLRVARLGKELISLCREMRKEEGQVLHRGLRVGAQFGDVVLGTLLPEYDWVAWGLSFLPWVGRGVTVKRGVDRENQREITPSSAVTSRARSELREKPLETSITDDLKRMDAQINRAFDELFDAYFNGEMRPASVDWRPVMAYSTSSDDQTLKAAFQEANDSLKEYYRRPFEKRLQVELKPGRNPQEFIEVIREYTRGFATHLLREEEAIEKCVLGGQAHSNEEEGNRVVNKLQRQKLGEDALSFEQIYELFTHCNDEEFLKRTELRPDKWPELKKRLYLYQTVRRRFNLMFNLVDQLRDGDFETLETVAMELKRRPAYDLGQKVPELVLRAKLSYEVALEFMLYKTAKQSEQLDRLLLAHWQPSEKVVLEQIMGTGKTFLMPISDRVFADGESLVFNIVIDPVAPSNFELFMRNGKKAFGQVGSILRFNRSMNWTTRQLWALQQVLQRATHLGEHMNARQKDIQALELRYLEEIFDVDGKFERAYGKTEWKKRLTIYRDIFRLLAQQGIENSDEKHKLDDPTTNILNYPLGSALTMQSPEIKVMNEVMLLLVTIPDFKDYVTIKSKRPEKLSPKVYREKIKSVLAHRIAKLEMLDISEAQRPEFVKYLMGEATSIPAFVKDSPHRRAIGQAKGCVTVLLEYALQCLTNVDFTVSKAGNGEYSRPANGNDDPLEDSTDLRPDVSYVKTLMRLFQTRLNQTQLKKLVLFLREQATTEAEKRGLHKQETLAGRFFSMHCPGYQIDTWQAEDLPKIMEKLNQSDRAMTLYAEEFIAPSIKFYRRFLSSNFANFHSIFGKKQNSRTGTPKNWRCYPQRTEILSHPGTEGESIHILEKKIGPASIHVLEESDPKPALRELIYRFFHTNPKALALIDLDPLCNNMSAEEVNEEFQRYIEEHRPELQGVVFYDQHKNLVIAEKGSSHTILLSESNVPPSKRISLFTHTQTTGSDIKQDKEAEAFLTVGENVTLTDLAQAFDRMREARRGAQQVSIVMTKRAHQRICRMLGKDVDDTLTMRDIIFLAIENETKKLDPHYRLAAGQILNDILYRAIRVRGDASETIEETIAIHRKYEDLFIIETEEDPFETYGYVDEILKPQVALQNLRQNLLDILTGCDYLTQDEKNDLEEELGLVPLDHSSGEVHVYRKDGKLSDNDQFLGQHAHQSQSQAQENESNQHSEVDTNTHIDVNQIAAPPAKEMPRSAKTHVGYQWPADLDPYDVEKYFTVSNPRDWFLKGDVPIYSLQDFVKLRSEVAFLSDSLDSAIYMTENFAQQRDNRAFRKASSITPFGERQSPLYKALVIQDRRSGSLQQKILLLHKDEIKFWRDKLEKLRLDKRSHPGLKLALYDFGTRSIEGEEIEQNLDFRRAIMQINFTVRGELSYTREEQKMLQSWIENEGPRRTRKAFEEVIYKERPVGCYLGSDVETVFFKAAGVPLDMRIRV